MLHELDRSMRHPTRSVAHKRPNFVRDEEDGMSVYRSEDGRFVIRQIRIPSEYHIGMAKLTWYYEDKSTGFAEQVISLRVGKGWAWDAVRSVK